MGWWPFSRRREAVRERVEPGFRATLEDPNTPINADQLAFITGGGPTMAGPLVSEATAIRCVDVYRCVSILSGLVASLRMNVYRTVNDKRDLAETHRLYPLLRVEPNENMSAFTWRELMMVNLLLWGNHSLGPLPGSGRAGSFQLSVRRLSSSSSRSTAERRSTRTSSARTTELQEHKMSIQLSTSVRNALLDVIESTIGASAIMKLRTGTKPADCATADSGAVLATLSLPADWMANASAGSKARAGTWQDSAADADGTVGHFRIYASDGTTCHMQGSVTAPGGGGDLTLDNVAVLTGEPINITSFTLTAPNA